jgi:hypothetical protein
MSDCFEHDDEYSSAIKTGNSLKEVNTWRLLEYEGVLYILQLSRR